MGSETFTWQRRDGYGQSDPHERGNEKCSACCCFHPLECDKCGGLVHSEAGDEVEVGDDWEKTHDLRCENCEATP